MFRYLFAVIALCFFLFPRNIFAESSYVLPYPSAMPGSVVYKLNIVKEEIMRYWHFGNFGQYKYNLRQSDKYLVEAKTLFEYKQYLLGVNALTKSNNYYVKIQPVLESAKRSNKDTSEKIKEFKDASQKHIEVLNKMKADSPQVVNWTPEKSASSVLEIEKLIVESIKQRENHE